MYSSGTRGERIEWDTAGRRRWYPSAEAHFAKVQAIRAWEAYSRLGQIGAPTLGIHGENDRLVPPENAKLIAARIPGAKLAMIPRASHIFVTDQTQAAHKAIMDLLGTQTNRQPQSPPPG